MIYAATISRILGKSGFDSAAKGHRPGFVVHQIEWLGSSGFYSGSETSSVEVLVWGGSLDDSRNLIPKYGKVLTENGYVVSNYSTTQDTTNSGVVVTSLKVTKP